MTPVIITSGLLVLIYAITVAADSDDFRSIVGFCCIVSFFAVGITSCAESDWYVKQQKANAAAEAADRVPRLISEADGCKVYAFKGGDHWQYFTRCPQAQTTTDTATTVTERHGKTTTTRVDHDVITNP